MNTYYGITLYDDGTVGEMMTLCCSRQPPVILENGKRTYWLDSQKTAERFRDASFEMKLIEI